MKCVFLRHFSKVYKIIRHPNIISYKEAFFEDSTSSLCIVMEFADGGDLYGQIIERTKKNARFHEDYIWKIFIQTVKGLKALHDHHILHRDLKSANIFLMKDGRAKLGDLNVSKVVKRGMLHTQTGTPYYASPEVWRDLPYDAKSDIWSLGCILYEIVTLKPPFRAQSMDALNKCVQKGNVSNKVVGIYPPIPSNYSPDLDKMIKTLLQLNAKKRPSCDYILDMPIIRNKTQELGLNEDSNETKTLAGSELLGTIQIPKNLMILRDKLPKPQYKSLEPPPEIDNELPSVKMNNLIQPNDSKAVLKRSVFPNVLPHIQNNDKIPQQLYLFPLYSQRKSSISPVPIEEEKENLLVNQPLMNNLADEKVKELPEIRRKTPIRRPPPRIPRYNKPQNEVYNIYSPLSIKRLKERAPIGNRKANLRQVYENMIKQNDLYSLLPKYKAPVVYNVYKSVNSYKAYNDHVHVQPHWWG